MKIKKKRITIVADILVDEDFDTNYLCICEWLPDDGVESYLGQSNNFEVLDYISQETVELDKFPEPCIDCENNSSEKCNRCFDGDESDEKI